jgi:hypothetical protein
MTRRRRTSGVRQRETGKRMGRERRVKAVERVGMPWELARGAFVVGKKGGGGGVEEDGVLDGEKEEEGG